MGLHHRVVLYKVLDGPGVMDLMLSLFDPHNYTSGAWLRSRQVKFVVEDDEGNRSTVGGVVVSASRELTNLRLFKLEVLVTDLPDVQDASQADLRLKGLYSTHYRKGTFELE